MGGHRGNDGNGVVWESEESSWVLMYLVSMEISACGGENLKHLAIEQTAFIIRYTFSVRHSIFNI